MSAILSSVFHTNLYDYTGSHALIKFSLIQLNLELKRKKIVLSNLELQLLYCTRRGTLFALVYNVILLVFDRVFIRDREGENQSNMMIEACGAMSAPW